MNPLTSIPSKYRQYIYVAYGVVALLVGAFAAFYLATPQTPLPEWLNGAQRVIAYLAIPVGALAAVNTTSADGPPPVPANDPPVDH